MPWDSCLWVWFWNLDPIDRQVHPASLYPWVPHRCPVWQQVGSPELSPFLVVRGLAEEWWKGKSETECRMLFLSRRWVEKKCNGKELKVTWWVGGSGKKANFECEKLHAVSLTSPCPPPSRFLFPPPLRYEPRFPRISHWQFSPRMRAYLTETWPTTTVWGITGSTRLCTKCTCSKDKELLGLNTSLPNGCHSVPLGRSRICPISDSTRPLWHVPWYVTWRSNCKGHGQKYQTRTGWVRFIDWSG